MSNTPDPKREVTDDDADRATYDAMQRDGKFVPQTPEEVAKAEAALNEAAVELPPKLRDPQAVLNPAPAAQPQTQPQAQQPKAEPSTARTPSTGTRDDARRARNRKIAIRIAVAVALAAFPVYQVIVWQSHVRDVRTASAALQAKQDALALATAERDAKRKETRKDVDAADAEAADVIKKYLETREAARKAIDEKDFVLWLTGPERIQPGAPNKWKIETLKHGADGRPNKLELAVKDGKDKELFRQTHDKPVGATTLELPVSFWTGVDPGTELFLEVVAHTENKKSVLAERLPLGRPVFVTHLVTDKPLYKPGETVRFRSLTLDRTSLRPPERDLHLIFKLRDPGDSVAVLDEGNGRVLHDLQPVIGPDKKPLRGLGVGEFSLPVTAPGGEYKLDLYERNAGKEALIESRKFIVNRYVPDTFEKKLEFDGKSYGPGDVVQARIEVSRTAGGPMKAAKAHVVASADSKSFFEQKDVKFTMIADVAGPKTVLDVRFKLPAEVFEKKDGVPAASLSVSIADGSDSEAIVRPIPLVTKNLKIEFFPEGGEMIEGVPGRVYFMVRTPHIGTRDLSPAKPGFTAAPGKPADIKGVIVDDKGAAVIDAETGKPIAADTLTDPTNPGVNRGHGVFALTPKAGAKYFLKLNTPIGITEPTKDGFPLPVAKADGVALTALAPVTQKTEAIRVRLQAAQPKTVHVGAYVRERLVAQQKLVLEANKAAEVALKSDELSGGVTRVTVFEEKKSDDFTRTIIVPRAERLVFRVQGEQLVLNAKPDKDRYAPAGKVRLALSASNEKGNPLPAVLMVGVVNRSVITMADNKTDRLMPTHFLLSGEVKSSADLEHADFLLTEHPKAGEALDLLLGTQGWRRFAEQEVTPPAQADKADVEQLLAAHGQRAAAPFELFKLEVQRVNAEFAPKLEQARLKLAIAFDEWDAKLGPEESKIPEARADVSAAQSHHSQAAVGLERFEERYKYAAGLLVRLLIFVLIVAGIFLTFHSALGGSPDPELRRYRRSIAGGAALVAIALLGAGYYILFDERHAKKSFEFVGSSIRPDSDPPSPSRNARLPNAMAAIEREETVKTSRAERVRREAELRAKVLDGLKNEDPGLDDPLGARFLEGMDEAWKVALTDGLRGHEHSSTLYGRSGATKSKIGKQSGGLQNDKNRLATVLSASRPRNGLYRMNEFTDNIGQPDAPNTDITSLPSPIDVITPGATGDTGNLMSGDGGSITGSGRRLTPPSVVREYAHQRDPALNDVRSDFTETVYWHPVLVLPDTGKAEIAFQLSDDIARYQVLVAGHTLDGRIGAFTTTIEARKPFSIDPKLPLEISHTDTINVPLRVTNDSDARRTVALTTALNGFKTTNPLQDRIDLGADGKGRKFLRVTPDKLNGSASLMIEGSSGTDKDAIARTIRVVPDGFPRVDSFGDMLEKGRGRGTVAIPKDMIPGSLKVRLEMYPTSMADLLKGLDGLLREPSGCFEQTSTSNYPNTLILDYLNQTNTANPEVAARAKDYLTRGYARLTGFECPETPTKSKRGYEWFGAADRPHLALTAYGLLQFKDMSRVSQVDPAMLKRTQTFLMSRKDGKGGFSQPADGHSFGMAPKHVVDAYVVWALVESDPDNVEGLDLKTEIATLKAEALNENSAGGKDAYFVSLVANTLVIRGDRDGAQKLLTRLREKHLKNGTVTGAVTSITRSGGRDLEIETTALALLAWLRSNDPAHGMAIKDVTKWLSQQRGGHGAFGSTQSTILALKALTAYAKKSAHPPEAGSLRVLIGGKEVATRAFTENDVDVIGLEIPNAEALFKAGEKTEVEIVTDAKHVYPFALAYVCTTTTPVSAEKCALKLGTRLAKSDAAEGEVVPLAVTLDNKLKTGHGMAVAIIGIPAGMKVPTDMKQLTELRETGAISFFEIRGRELVLYWRELAPEQKIALTVDLVCDVPGEYRGPASRAYLYYDADYKHWVEPLAAKIAPMKE